MKIFKTSQIKEIDSYTISNEPIESVDLMERAANACTDWIFENIEPERSIKLFAGPGNNGGDVWAIARILANLNFKKLTFFLLKISDNISADSEINRKRLYDLGKVPVNEISDVSSFPEIYKEDIIIDGLFGSGLTRPVIGLAADLIRQINHSGAAVISIDIPSGLYGEDNSQNNYDNIIKAKYTLTFQFPKLSFFFAENEDYVGEWHVLPIGLHPEVIEKKPSVYHFLTSNEIAVKIKKRKKFSHKGTYGNALLIAGSYGMMGAAVMAAKACLRSGAGLVTSHIPVNGVKVMQTAFPESIVSIDNSQEIFTKLPDISKFDAIAIGPGINTKTETQKAFKNLLETSDKPLVIDADALNILGLNKDWFKLIPKNSILTPHPKEFERLAGKTKNSFERMQRQLEFAQQNGIYIVVKGAYSTVACPDGNCFFNSTGNPGMATAGSGDVLTGIILSLLAQKYSPENAVLTGVFLHGLAADLAVNEVGENSLISSDIIEHIGNAFMNLEKTI